MMAPMALDARSYPWPSLQAWAAVDPARHPFDPAGARAAVRSIAHSVPLPARIDPGLPWRERKPARDEAFQWYMEVSVALIERYGDWARGWHWAPGAGDYAGRLSARCDIWEAITTPPVETLALVADELVAWRRWLERLAGDFDRLLPALRPGGPPARADLAVWEAAITHLTLLSVAHAEDPDRWQGTCARTLTWFLNAAGVPEERSARLVDGVLDERFSGWASLSAADVPDLAERLAREAAGPARAGLARTGEGADDWPDTWPHGWPSWRATNFARDHS